ncbi:MAG: BT4734/BF3469 family protein [Parabacteroides merdae]
MRSKHTARSSGLDFDHVKDLPALILTFRALSSTLAMFVSPGGEGLKVFVRVDRPAERHGEAYPLSPPSSRRQAVWQAMPSARTSAVAATWATTGGVLQSGRGSLPHPRKAIGRKGCRRVCRTFPRPHPAAGRSA